MLHLASRVVRDPTHGNHWMDVSKHALVHVPHLVDCFASTGHEMTLSFASFEVCPQFYIIVGTNQ
jgi:hypothetical protein